MSEEILQLAKALAACMREVDMLEIALGNDPHAPCEAVINGRHLLNKLYASGKVIDLQ